MADIKQCDDTAPHLAHVWTTILDRLVCVGVQPRLVTSAPPPVWEVAGEQRD